MIKEAASPSIVKMAIFSTRVNLTFVLFITITSTSIIVQI